ncbi:alpha/beta-hydrolase [Neocallimastix californiae]|uniref:Alpha/beta-hydrolase n=1 Tax=Neocallimastix californiae TaxID=1754190 RepID=A0A1Y2ACY7_9FUNG|nr:alpha/beta-hydrolase [Neocallimastix californiae]|eukprot:ORY20366.1 alpha/beta-hydrolase [Neocallimastix californiae]
MKIISLSSIILILITVLNVSAGPIEDYIYVQKNMNIIRKKEIVEPNIIFNQSTKSKMDVYYDKKDIQNLKPVVIFSHGGGWISGDKKNFIGVGTYLREQGYVAVLPNYILFPQGKVDDMVDDIYQSIQWTYNNISKYGGNKNKIILVGYSAGAHLTALTTIKVTLGIKNKNKILAPLPKIEKMVLFNGPYDFDDFDSISKLFTQNEINNGIIQNIVKALVNSDDISPTNILKKYPDNSVSNFGFPKITFYWADKDNLIPVNSAPNLITQIRRVSPSTEINSIFNEGNGFDHATLLIGVRDGKPEMQKMFLEIVEM